MNEEILTVREKKVLFLKEFIEIVNHMTLEGDAEYLNQFIVTVVQKSEVYKFENLSKEMMTKWMNESTGKE